MARGDGLTTRPPPSLFGWGMGAATAVTTHGLLLLLPGLSESVRQGPAHAAPSVTITLVTPAPPPSLAADRLSAGPRPETPAPMILDPLEDALPDVALPEPPKPKPRRLVELGEGLALPDPTRADHFAVRAAHAARDTRAADELPTARQDEANTPGVAARTGAQAERVNTAREDPGERRGEDIADAGDGEDRRSPQAATGAATDGEADHEDVRATPLADAAQDQAPEVPSDEPADALAQLLTAEPPRPQTPSRPVEADRDAPPDAPRGERPTGERLQAPAPPPTPETAAPPPPRASSAPKAERAGPARPGQTDGDGDGLGGRSARPDEPIITLPGAPHVAGAGAPTSPAARLDLQVGDVSQVATVADPIAAWLGDVHKVARVGFAEAVPVQLKLDGVEGAAEVNFCVNRRGKVWEPTLSESSGVAGLDNAALAALPARVPRPPEEAELRGLGACYPHAINFVQVNDRR
jgi:TonB family protein